MKKILGGILGLMMFLGLATMARANEGVVRLFGKTEAEGKCYAVSIYVDGSYKIMMTCRGLKVAQDPVYNRYVAWAEVEGKNQRLGEIVAGKMQGNLQNKFDYMFVTVEKDGYPTTASESVVMSGRMEAIDFGKGGKDEAFVPATVVPTIVSNSSKGNTVTTVSSSTATVTSTTPSNKLVAVVTGVGKAILLGFILLLVVVGIMGFLAKRKSL